VGQGEPQELLHLAILNRGFELRGCRARGGIRGLGEARRTGPGGLFELDLQRGMRLFPRRLGRGTEPRRHVTHETDQVFVQLFHRGVSAPRIAGQALRHHRFEAG
jgi:hypothetical protein